MYILFLKVFSFNFFPVCQEYFHSIFPVCQEYFHFSFSPFARNIFIQVYPRLPGTDWVDPQDPTVIAENELLSAASSIEAAAKKLSQLQPRKQAKVSGGMVTSH